jgi:hypothetical protein
MNAKSHKNKLFGGVIVTLSLLPGCWLLDSFKGKGNEEAMEQAATMDMTPAESPVAMAGDVLVTMDGKPIITTSILAVEKENIFKSNPQIKAAIAFMDPKVLDRNLTEGLVSQAVVDRFVTDAQLNQSAAYKTELKDAFKAIERMLNAKYFSQKFNVAVSDSEARSFYDANKDVVQGLLISHGGIAAMGIPFDDEATAQAFKASVRSAQAADFKNAAQQAGLSGKMKDFKIVNGQSIGIEPLLRDQIVTIKTVPSLEVIAANNSFWVVDAISKEEPKYRPFDQIKDNIKEELEKNKRAEMFEKEISRLKQDYNIVVNEDYFKGAGADMSDQDNEDDMQAPMRTGGFADASHDDVASKRLA